MQCINVNNYGVMAGRSEGENQDRDISLSDRDVSLPDRDMSPSDRDMSLSDTDMSLTHRGL